MAAQQLSNRTPATAASKKRLVLGCGALVYELVALIKHQPALNDRVHLHCLPAHLHNTPQFIATEVDKFLAQHADDYESVYVAYADCGTAGELDKVLDKYHAQRLPGAHCYEFFAGTSQFEALMQEELGSFFLTDYLVKFFDRLIMQGLGLNETPEFKELYFKHYKRLVYLAQTQDEDLQALAQDQAQALGLDYEYRFVGISSLAPVAKFAGLDEQAIAVEVKHVLA